MTRKQYIYAFDEAFSAALHAAKDCGFNIESVDKDAGKIRLTTPGSIWSWGENILITISSTGEGSEVSIDSEAQAQLFDWGKSGDNKSKLFQFLENRLKN